MAKDFDFECSSNQLLTMSLKKKEEGDLLSAIRYAKQALKKNKSNILTHYTLGRLYADAGEYELSNNVFFECMHIFRAWDDKKIRRRLARNFIRLDLPEVAFYYADEDDIEVLEYLDAVEMSQESEPDSADEWYLEYPRTDDYYGHIYSRACNIAAAGEFSNAVSMLNEIPDDSAFAQDAARTKIMLYTLLTDWDSAIGLGEKAVEKYPQSKSMRCALANAYMRADCKADALRILEPLFLEQNPAMETAYVLLPMAIELKLHGDIVRLVKHIGTFESSFSMPVMIWFSIALYNIGERVEARKVMTAVNTVYGEESPAVYYLDLFAQQPDSIEYCMAAPAELFQINLAKIAQILDMSDDEIVKFDREHKNDCDNLRYYILWTLSCGSAKLKDRLVDRFYFPDGSCKLPVVDGILKDALHIDDMPVDTVTPLLFKFLREHDGSAPIVLDIVAQHRFKHISLTTPRAFKYLPDTFLMAVIQGYLDIIYTDEDANLYLNKLSAVVDEIVDVDGQGKIVFSSKRREKIAAVRNAPALMGVLLGKVYEEEESRDDLIERYGIKPNLFDKYHSILFGEDDE